MADDAEEKTDLQNETSDEPQTNQNQEEAPSDEIKESGEAHESGETEETATTVEAEETADETRAGEGAEKEGEEEAVAEGETADGGIQEEGEGGQTEGGETVEAGEGATGKAVEGQEGAGGEGEADAETGGKVEGKEAETEGDQKHEGEEGEVKAEGVEGDEKPEGEEGEQKPEGEEGEAKPEGEDGEAKQEGEEGEEKPEGEEAETKPEGEEGEEKPEGEEEEKPEGEAGEVSDIEGTTMLDEVTEDGEPQRLGVTFEVEGEEMDETMKVAEKLSREGSERGSIPSDERADLEHLDLGTPREGEEGEYYIEGDEEEEEGDEEEEEEEMFFDRELLIEKYKQATQERKQLLEVNTQFQHKLSEYFRKKKADSEAAGRIDMDKGAADHEQRYIKYIANLDDLRRQYTELQEEYRTEIENLKEECTSKQEEVDAERVRFMEYKQVVGLKAINSRTGRPIAPKDLEQLLANEHKKESEVVHVRLENIKMQNKLHKEELALKSKEELAEGLHLIDFEQLKIENQTYNEKIEERNEELLKLRKKITSTVQVLTHLKEKLQFVQAENHKQRDKLTDVDGVLGRKRDVLTRTKQSRDALRIHNNRLRQNCGLLGNERLLRDFEECVDKKDDRQRQLEMMRMEHAELSLNMTGLKRKIEQSKSASSQGRN